MAELTWHEKELKVASAVKSQDTPKRHAHLACDGGMNACTYGSDTMLCLY